MTVCYATRERLAAQRRYETLHKALPYHDGNGRWVKDPSDASPYHFLDGATVWVSQVDFEQGGDFLQQKDEDD